MNNVAFFLPVRAGSQRVENKNTKTFAGIKGGLLANKLRQLSELKLVEEVILSTNDDEAIGVANEMAFPKLRSHTSTTSLKPLYLLGAA